MLFAVTPSMSSPPQSYAASCDEAERMKRFLEASLSEDMTTRFWENPKVVLQNICRLSSGESGCSLSATQRLKTEMLAFYYVQVRQESAFDTRGQFLVDDFSAWLNTILSLSFTHETKFHFEEKERKELAQSVFFHSAKREICFQFSPTCHSQFSVTNHIENMRVLAKNPESFGAFLSRLAAGDLACDWGANIGIQDALLQALSEKMIVRTEHVLPLLSFLEERKEYCKQPRIQEALAKAIYENCFGSDPVVLQRLVKWVGDVDYFCWSEVKAQRYLAAAIYADTFGTSIEVRVQLAKNIRAVNWSDEKTKVFLALLISEGKFGKEEAVVRELRHSVRVISWNVGKAMKHLRQAAIDGCLGENGFDVFKPSPSDLDAIAEELERALEAGLIVDKKPYRLETAKGLVHVSKSGNEISIIVADKKHSYDFFDTKGSSKFIKPNAYLLTFERQKTDRGMILSAKSVERIVTVSRKSPAVLVAERDHFSDFKVFVKKDSRGNDVCLYYTPYLGVDLFNMLKQGHRFTTEELHELFDYVMRFVHEKGYNVHDFKPSNVLYDEDKKRYRVIDYKSFFYTSKYTTRDSLAKLHSTALVDKKFVVFTSVILSFLELVGIEQSAEGKLVKNKEFCLPMARDVVGFFRGVRDAAFVQAFLPFAGALRW